MGVTRRDRRKMALNELGMLGPGARLSGAGVWCPSIIMARLPLRKLCTIF